MTRRGSQLDRVQSDYYEATVACFSKLVALYLGNHRAGLAFIIYADWVKSFCQK